MNEENKPLGEGQEFDGREPDTSTNDELSQDLEESSQPAFPIADVAPSDPEESGPPPLPVAAAPAGPRSFPEHYWLLLGGSCVVASTLSVWERREIYGHEIWGGHSVLRTLMMALGLYVVAVGIANISSGRLKGMGLSFVTGVMALWLGVKGLLAFNSVEGFEGWSALGKRLADSSGVNLKLHVEAFLAQWGPGVWLSTIGGAVIILIFLKAVFFGGGKKKAAVPAPTPRRRGRR